jgi:NAD(P)-dependent dehydrogenase (short-subunit alcohol dehydrogenase family)
LGKIAVSSHEKVAVITGASQGIGASLVKAYLDAGYRVVGNSRVMPTDADPNVLSISGDIGDPNVAKQVIAGGFEAFGRIDTLVNNAGVFTAKPFTELTADDWKANIQTNLAGFFLCNQ